MKLANYFPFSFKGLGLLAILSFAGMSEVFATTHTINFAGISFTPNTLNVVVGDTIVWKGAFGFHVIKNTAGAIPNGAATFGPSKSTDTSLVYVVAVSGHYDYQCTVHVALGMTGSFDASPKSDVKSGVNHSFSLEQNYPNPSNAITKIQYTLDQASEVRLTISDIEGKGVKQLVNKYQGGGSYEILFDASTFANGTYVYQLQAGDAVLTRQMIVVKK